MHSKFVLRNHVDKKGKSPIYLHLTQDGKRERINLKYKLKKVLEFKKNISADFMR